MVKYICPRGITLDSHLFAFSPIIIHVLGCCHVLIVHMLNDPDMILTDSATEDAFRLDRL